MTTREQIIAAAKECFDCYEDGRGRFEYSADEYGLERFYAIAFEAGRVAEREECAAYFNNAAKITDVSSRANTRNIYTAVATAIRARGESK